ncbi:succinate dehydrogenase / fumarate reductase, cytochrome b subunit [Novimethylophilus kurashikiensis]|uniref:Succinate dehydrogenase cytochrome b556 subunit n=1 Tax=Novimethylophilus kurashikiensis TaxID=1825523 RepID=A0A2R5F8Q1_9PROT|nr:succinate dehydrogenase / fumarate reductase, cytochrome b subunit [Novimethylophilus kurashikiensis]
MNQARNLNRKDKQRPKNLDLRTVRLPVPALVSILHRASGAVLFLLLPVLLLGLQCSLNSAEHFAHIKEVAAQPFVKLLLLGVVWAFSHHFFAGLRHIAMDFQWGMELTTARLTAKLVLALGLLVTLLIGTALW